MMMLLAGAAAVGIRLCKCAPRRLGGHLILTHQSSRSPPDCDHWSSCSSTKMYKLISNYLIKQTSNEQTVLSIHNKRLSTLLLSHLD